MSSAWIFLVPTITASSAGIGDMIGPIIIFVVIISQMIRAARNFTKNKPGHTVPNAKPQSRSPEEELRDFLGGLSGESRKAPEPARQPDVNTTTWNQAPPAVSGKTFTILRRSPPKEPQPVMPTEPVELPLPVAIPVAKAEPMRIGRDLIRSDITAALSTRQLLRQAIVLREVLGPPLGLRR